MTVTRRQYRREGEESRRAALIAATQSLVRYANPSEIANAVAFFSSLEANFVSGQVLPVDGGITLHAL